MERSSLTLMKTDKSGKPLPVYTPLVKTLKKLPSDCLGENFYVTTSGMLWTQALMCALSSLGSDRVLFAVDYPMEPNQDAVQFIATAPISERDKEKILHLNAEKLFAL